MSLEINKKIKHWVLDESDISNQPSNIHWKSSCIVNHSSPSIKRIESSNIIDDIIIIVYAHWCKCLSFIIVRPYSCKVFFIMFFHRVFHVFEGITNKLLRGQVLCTLPYNLLFSYSLSETLLFIENGSSSWSTMNNSIQQDFLWLSNDCFHSITKWGITLNLECMHDLSYRITFTYNRCLFVPSETKKSMHINNRMSGQTLVLVTRIIERIS